MSLFTDRIRAGLLAGAFGIVVPGCTVGAADAEGADLAINQCSEGADCGAGRCIDGVCVASSGEFATVLLEVTPPADADAAGVRFLKRLEGLPLEGGSRDIVLDPVVRVRGRVRAEIDDCPPLRFLGDPIDSVYQPAADGSLPVRVVLTPSARLLGVSTGTYAAEAIPRLDQEHQPIQESELPFTLDLPPGEYDVYVQPLPQTELEPGQTHCIITPRLYRRWEIQTAEPDLEVALNLDLSAASTLDLTVELPANVGSLEDWTADVLDPVSGRLISNQVKLGTPTVLGDVVQHTVEISYAPVIAPLSDEAPSASALELVRLAPPEGSTAPSIITERWVLDIDGDGAATINQITMLPEAVSVEGQLTGEQAGVVPSGGTVTLIATEIGGLNKNVTASFARTVDAVPPRPGDAPKFVVSLLPGKYLVYAVPPADSGLAATQTTWEVGAAPAMQFGRVIDLGPTASLVGGAFDPTAGAPVVGSSVHALAAAVGSTITVRDRAVWDILPFVPRASTVVVDSQGAFEVRADPGTFDVSVRPPPRSGFAWLVKPNIVVGPAGRELGSMILPLPIAYQGSVTMPGAGNDDVVSSVPNALIRAYIYVDENRGYTGEASQGLSALQIAETRADDMGRYQLLLPSHLH